jgi:hypothetical protein
MRGFVSLTWIVAGFLFPLLTPATDALTTILQPFLSSVSGLSNEVLAFRVTVTFVRLPLTGLFGLLVAAGQYAVVPGVGPFARRWLIASATGGAVSTLVLLPASLILIQIMTRTFFVLLGALLFGVLVALSQRRAVRGKSAVPAWFIVAGALGTPAGAFLGLASLG